MNVPNSIKVLHYLNAGYPALWVKTQEPERAQANIVSEIELWDKKIGNCFRTKTE